MVDAIVSALCRGAYIATSEVTPLKHELRDHTVELRARVAKALLTSAESTEILDSLGNDIVEELEVDAAGLLCARESVE